MTDFVVKKGTVITFDTEEGVEKKGYCAYIDEGDMEDLPYLVVTSSKGCGEWVGDDHIISVEERNINIMSVIGAYVEGTLEGDSLKARGDRVVPEEGDVVAFKTFSGKIRKGYCSAVEYDRSGFKVSLNNHSKFIGRWVYQREVMYVEKRSVDIISFIDDYIEGKISTHIMRKKQ